MEERALTTLYTLAVFLLCGSLAAMQISGTPLLLPGAVAGALLATFALTELVT